MKATPTIVKRADAKITVDRIGVTPASLLLSACFLH